MILLELGLFFPPLGTAVLLLFPVSRWLRRSGEGQCWPCRVSALGKCGTKQRLTQGSICKRQSEIGFIQSKDWELGFALFNSLGGGTGSSYIKYGLMNVWKVGAGRSAPEF